MSEDNDSSGFEDFDAEYSPKSEFSKPKVCEDAVRRCLELRAKEMRAGYFNTNISKDGLPLKSWVEDSRKVYCSAVISLKKLLGPEIRGDKKYKNIKLGSILKKYSYFKLVKVTVGDKTIYKKTDEYHMPEIDESVYIRKVFENGSEELITIKGKWNPQVNAYWNHMVKKCDLLFDELVTVIHRLNYFKQSIRFG